MRVAVANHADSRDAHSQQIGITLSGVALEVAMQDTFPLGNRQLVIRAGKVIHADKLIASIGQRGDGFLQDIQLLLGGWQVGVFDFALCGE